jgi:hypothetical protein
MKVRWLVIASALLGVVAVVAVVAVYPAHARARKSKPKCVEQAYTFSWQDFLFGPGRTPAPNGCAPPVYVGGRYVGQDPDPNIRFQLMREPWTGYTVDMQ